MSDRKPNWNKWKLIPNAKIWAVAALSLDIDPDKVKHNPQGWMANAFTTLEGQDFKDRVEVITANAMNDKSSLLYLVTLNQGGVEYCEISIANFAKWAISKSLSLPSELAGLASKELGSSKVLFDNSKPNYPVELDFAVKAWQAVSTSEGKGKPKARIKKWLDENTELSNEAKERIATVANWDKTGGATKT